MNRHAPQSHPGEVLLAVGTVKHFAQDQPIHREGDPAGYFMQVLAGVVRSVKLLRDGRRYIEAFHLSGDVFGMEDESHYTKSAEAVGTCVAVFYPQHGHAPLNAGRDELFAQLHRARQRELRQAKAHAQLLCQTSALQKTAAFLLECCGRNGAWPLVTLAMTRQDIADYLGLTHETVSRSLAQLQRGALIEIHSAREIRLLDMPALQAMVI